MREKFNLSPLRDGWSPWLWGFGLLVCGLLLTVSGSAMLVSEMDINPAWVLGSGTLLSLLLAGGLGLALTGRARSQVVAHATTLELVRLATVVRRTSHLVMTTDAKNNITWVNAAFSRATGLSAADAVGNNLISLFRHASDPPTLAQFRAALEQRTSLRMQYPHQSLSGVTLWLDLDLQPEHDAAGQFSGFVAIASDISAQRAAAEQLAWALRENQALMEAIDQHSIVSIADTAGTITYANPMFSRISGYSCEELKGQNHRIIRSDVQSTEFWAAMWKTISSGHTWRDVICNRARDGSLYWVDTVVAPFFNESGTIEKYVSIRTDVTASRAAQQALRVEREHLNHIIMDTHVGTWEWNVKTGAFVVNERWAGMLGYELAELAPVSQQTWAEHCHPDDLAGAEQLLAQHLETGIGYYDCELRMRHRDGHWVWVHSRAKTSSRSTDGRPEWVSGTQMDISERKHAEAEVARTTSMLQSVLDSASEVAVITSGLDRIITLFNTGAERMLGYSADEMVGKQTTNLFFDPEEVQARAAALSIELGRPIRGSAMALDEATIGKKTQWTWIRKDGSRIVVALVVTPLSDARGVRTGYLGISHDISIEKEYENGLRAAMEEAEAATLAKSQFLANMSHEIRTPMNAILGMLRLLHNTEQSARQLDYTSKAEGAAQSLLGLLNNILDFSKVEADKMTLDPQPFELDRLLRELSVILAANVGHKPVEVLFEIDPEAPPILIGDSLRLQQVLLNLGGNAIKFTAQGDVLIQVKVLARSGPATTLRISVRDSGIGIAPENQQHIFDGFSQAEASTTRRFGGTGLGLSICKRLVALMGGELALDSVLGQGSTFHFTITLPSADQVPDMALRASAQVKTPLRVLVVDDHVLAREVLVAMVQSLGWQADAAGSGSEAIDLIAARGNSAQSPYQAIFMDWQMPGMDGWETSLRIRQMTLAVDDAPIIVMVTAHGREMLMQRSGQEQARLNGFLVKPVTASMLFEAVADARAGYRSLRAGARAKAAKQRPLEGVRLLIVEDNLINQQVAQELLSAEGALIEIADNGQLGVAAVAGARVPFDAVLMDLQMPVMDGYSATRAIRHELGLMQLPVIAMTANAMNVDREACLAAGMNDHIGKPFDLAHLIKVLHSHIRRPNGSATAADRVSTRSADDDIGGDEVRNRASGVKRDADAALRRLGGNTDLYARILRSYLAEIADLPDKLEGLLLRGGWADAVQLLHTVKGLSATVGASQLAALARALESRLEREQGVAGQDAWRGDFRAAVTATIGALGQIADGLPAPAAPNSASDPQAMKDRSGLVAELDELKALLRNADMRAIEVHAKLRDALSHGGVAVEKVKRLDAAVAALDFAQAVVQCDTLIQQLSPST